MTDPGSLRLTLVCKRAPQQRDLVTRPYGRFHHLPLELAKLGHQVQVLLVSHQGLPTESGSAPNLQWSSDDLRTLGPWKLYRRVMERAAGFAPDWVVGLSDATFGWLAGRVSRRLGSRLAIDAYDDYESYMPWNLPLHLAWRGTLRRADLVTAAGPQLAALMATRRSPRQSAVQILPMTADPEFTPMDMPACRAALGLPSSAPLVGYAGGWGTPRGTDILVRAWEQVHAMRPDAILVLSGKPPASVASLAGVHSTGYLPDASMPLLLNALNVACVLAADSRFSRSSYPSKLCEAMACQTAVVASASEPVRWMLGADSRGLVPVGDAPALAAGILSNLESGKVRYPAQRGWPELARDFAAMLATAPVGKA